MSWTQGLAEARAWAKAYVDRKIIGLFGWTQTTNASAGGEADQVESCDEGVDPGTAEKSQRQTTRVEPFGHRARGPKGLRALWLKLGESNVFFIGFGPSEKYGPQDLDVGEVAVYNVTKALIRLWKLGKLTVDSDVSASQDVVVNGGTLPVARKTDKTIADTTMATWVANVTAKFNAPAAPMASAPGTLTPPTDFGVINGGASNFKG
jgi:phage gp45-like